MFAIVKLFFLAFSSSMLNIFVFSVYYHCHRIRLACYVFTSQWSVTSSSQRHTMKRRGTAVPKKKNATSSAFGVQNALYVSFFLLPAF